MTKKKQAQQAADKKSAVDKTDQEQPQTAVLLELENVAVNGRQIIYDVFKSVLADKTMKLTPLMFSRYCLDPSSKDFLQALLEVMGKKRLSHEKLLAEITQGIKLSFTDGTVKLESGFKKVLKRATEHNTLVGVLSGLDEETARQLMTKLGLDNMAANLFSYASEDRNFPTSDAWLKLAKNLSIPPYMCIVVATGSASCRAALSGGMKCVVVPDKFTSFQDFSGTDYMIDVLNDAAVEQIFALLGF